MSINKTTAGFAYAASGCFKSTGSIILIAISFNTEHLCGLNFHHQYRNDFMLLYWPQFQVSIILA